MTSLHFLSALLTLGAQEPGSLAADRARVAEITRDSTYNWPASRHFFRRLGSTRSGSVFSRAELKALSPRSTIVWNSTIPLSLNDGALWSGRGVSLSVDAGAEISQRHRFGELTIALAPGLLYSQNLPFQVRPNTAQGRSSFASPFHQIPFSADLPSRFGDRHVLRVDPGRSGVRARVAGTSFGITADNEVWGPGIRNQLVMSANAPGIPRLFVGTARPVRTPVGAVRARLISGALTESNFFDANSANDLRSVSGIVVALAPRFDSTLTLGFERVVYRPLARQKGPLIGALTRSMDALIVWEYLRPPGDTAPQIADQIVGLFARWIAPGSGFEAYAEWARLEIPRSLSELFTATHHTLGYTIGFQWAQPRSNHHYLRLQAEFTNLEQSRVLPGRAPSDFYTGQVSPHGYTNRGQVIGAAIGPGASSQWFAIDWLAPRWQSGWYAGRIRWENDAMYREAIPHLFLHDVTLLTGLRGARRTPWTDVSLDVAFGYRFNYLFQNGIPQPSGFAFRTVDVRNLTVALAIMPR